MHPWPPNYSEPDQELLLEDEVLAQTLEFQNKNDEISQAVSQQLNLGGFLVVNQITNISIFEWLGQDEWTLKHGLPKVVKQALLYEAQQILDRRARERNDQEQKIKLEKLQQQQTGAMDLSHNLGGIKNYLQ